MLVHSVAIAKLCHSEKKLWQKKHLSVYLAEVQHLRGDAMNKQQYSKNAVVLIFIQLIPR